jgi:hypothetical protein
MELLLLVIIIIIIIIIIIPYNLDSGCLRPPTGTTITEHRREDTRVYSKSLYFSPKFHAAI